MAHILIIEPDRVLAGSLETYFANANHTATIHADPQAALISADRRKPDVVVAELQLAARSGVEFLYEFSSYPDWQSIPIIIFTNLSVEQIVPYQEALGDLNITACLTKSHDGLTGLLRAVRQNLPQHAKV
jgi:DNA-binding response OmpR family regulator